MLKEHPYLRGALIGALGFSLGSLLGDFARYLLFRSNLTDIVLGQIGEGQALVRLYTAIILVLIIIVVGSGIGGAIGGLALSYIDRSARRMRYILGSAFAFAVGQGIVIIPLLLLLSVIALYNNGPRGRPLNFIIIFAILGLVYGLVSGIVLALMTLRFRYTWRAILAAIFGYGIGGGILGYLIYWADLSAIRAFSIGELIFLLLAIVLAINVPSGALLGLAYSWVARKRFSAGDEAVRPARLQQGIVVAISVLALFMLTSFNRQIASFLTSQPSSTATELPSKTVGVRWSSPALVVQNRAQETSQPASYAGEGEQVAVGWAEDTGENSDIFFTWKDTSLAGETDWSEPVNVSASPEIASSQPGIIVDQEGNAHVVWIEAVSEAGSTDILYSRCQGAACSPPQSLSSLEALACAAPSASEIGERHLNPAIAIDEDNTIMVAWDAGSSVLPYLSWPASEELSAASGGCLPAADPGENGEHDLRLAAGAAGEFALVYTSDQSSEIYLQQFSDQSWSAVPQQLGQGAWPEVYVDKTGQVHTVWCGEHKALQYRTPAGQVEPIEFPGCIGRPGLGQDSDGQMHLVWYADQVEKYSGTVEPADLIYESIRTEAGWSAAAIIAQPGLRAQPGLASNDSEALHLIWGGELDGTEGIFYARQNSYACEPESLADTALAVLGVQESGTFRPSSEQVPYCGNQFDRIVYTPNPKAEFSTLPPTPNGAFDRVAELVTTAQYEVLFTTMQWEPDENDFNPGTTLSRAVADLYRQVKQDPSQYPKGMKVRILLGNYPELANFEWGDQIWSALEDLREAGVEEMVNPDIGWQLEVANFSGTYPHSHSKFLVLDGKTLLGAGFNYGYLHFTKDHPSGKGDDLVDLGLQVEGPVAQQALLAYDDLWTGSNGVHCEDFYPEDPDQWKSTCSEWKGTTEHIPEVLKYYLPGGDDNAFSLYRSGVYLEADESIKAAISSAEDSLDVVHVNFSLELICAAAVLDENICSYNDALPYMEAIMTAVEQNQTRVRVMAEQSNMNGLENRVAMQVFAEELEKRGLSDYVELRFFNGRLHAKSVLIDDELVIIGSHNFHYSSWGEGGLTEYSLATDSPAAVEAYKDLFEYQWERALSSDTAWKSSSK